MWSKQNQRDGKRRQKTTRYFCLELSMCKVTVRPELCHSVKNLFTKMQLILAKSAAQSVDVALAVLGEHLDLLVFKVLSIKIILQFYIQKNKQLCYPFMIIFHLKKEIINEGEETLAQGAQGDDANP